MPITPFQPPFSITSALVIPDNEWDNPKDRNKKKRELDESYILATKTKLNHFPVFESTYTPQYIGENRQFICMGDNPCYRIDKETGQKRYYACSNVKNRCYKIFIKNTNDIDKKKGRLLHDNDKKTVAVSITSVGINRR